jgi:hypothetical protein
LALTFFHVRQKNQATMKLALALLLVFSLHQGEANVLRGFFKQADESNEAHDRRYLMNKAPKPPKQSSTLAPLVPATTTKAATTVPAPAPPRATTVPAAASVPGSTARPTVFDPATANTATAGGSCTIPTAVSAYYAELAAISGKGPDLQVCSTNADCAGYKGGGSGTGGQVTTGLPRGRTCCIFPRCLCGYENTSGGAYCSAS